MPDAPAHSKTTLTGANGNPNSFQDTRNLVEAFGLLSKYGDEYLDENTLVGEPGSFILSKSSNAAAAGRPVPKAAIQAPSIPGRTGTPTLTEVSTPTGRSVRGSEIDLADARDKSKKRKS